MLFGALMMLVRQQEGPQKVLLQLFAKINFWEPGLALDKLPGQTKSKVAISISNVSPHEQV